MTLAFKLAATLAAGYLTGVLVGHAGDRREAIDDLAEQLADEPQETEASSATTAPFPALRAAMQRAKADLDATIGVFDDVTPDDITGGKA